MKYISELRGILGQQLNWHKSRVDCFTQMLLALFTVRSVSLSEIAVAMQDKTNKESREKRVYRFFRYFEVDFTCIAKWLYYLMFSEDEKVYIAIDRTNWYWGKAKINIFMLSVCYEGIAIPIFWTLLKKAGTSTGEEQKQLVKRFINCFGQDRIESILGDREFANQGFICWLNQNKIPFHIRIKEGAWVSIGKKKYKKAGQLFGNLSPMEHSAFGMRITIFGQDLFLAGSKNEREELMIVATNQPPKTAIAVYLRRWEIETLFCSLKSKGWQLENTRMTDNQRLEKLIALLAVAFVWAHKIGEFQATQKRIPLKTLRKQRRPQNSFFRLGLDCLRDLLTSFYSNFRKFKNYLKCLVCDQL